MILARIVGKVSRSIRLVAKTEPVDESDAALPVSDERISRRRAVDVILTAREVPHEVAPVHPVHLVVEEESQVLEECRLVVLRAADLVSAARHV